MVYAEKIKMLRERNGLTQENMAKIIDIDRKTYNNYENKVSTMPLKHLNMLCNYFDVSLDYIFDFSNIEQYNENKSEINIVKLGTRLKEFRKNNKLTQVKLANILNTVHPVITNYEKGKHLISTSFLYTICKKYNVSADYLLGKIDYIPEW